MVVLQIQGHHTLYSSRELYKSSPSTSGLDGPLYICVVKNPPRLQFLCNRYGAMRVRNVTSLRMLLLFSRHPAGEMLHTLTFPSQVSPQNIGLSGDYCTSPIHACSS